MMGVAKMVNRLFANAPKCCMTNLLNLLIYQKLILRTGGAAQVRGPEFKHQYHKK
jgi:hypothetical protein